MLGGVFRNLLSRGGHAAQPRSEATETSHADSERHYMKICNLKMVSRQVFELRRFKKPSIANIS